MLLDGTQPRFHVDGGAFFASLSKQERKFKRPVFEMPNRQPICYAKRPTGIRRYWGRLLLLAIVVASVGFGARLRRTICARANVLLAQRRLERYELPPGQIVFSTYPDEIKAFSSRPDYFKTEVDREGNDWHVDPDGISFWPVLPLLDVHTMTAWRDGPSTLFAHGINTPSGASRLVVVVLYFSTREFLQASVARRYTYNVTSECPQVDGPVDFYHLVIQTQAYVPVGLGPTSVPRPIYRQGSSGQGYQRFPITSFLMPERMSPSRYGPIPTMAWCRFYPGVPDASDESKIRVPYEIEENRGVLVGQILDDADPTWTVESGPLTPWPGVY